MYIGCDPSRSGHGILYMIPQAMDRLAQRVLRLRPVMVLWTVLSAHGVVHSQPSPAQGVVHIERAKEAETANRLVQALSHLDTALQVGVAGRDTALQADA